MGYRILINREVCEVRVAFLQEQELVELHTEKFDDHTIVNNIYRGRIQDVVPGLQAAFVDVGLERNMFLHFMDIRPESLVLGADDQLEAMRAASQTVIPGRIEKPGRRPRQDPRAPQAAPPVKKGDQIIVQVVKDEIGGKAPRVTANVSLAGRYLVMLPFPSQEGGVSRKIALGQDRFRLKKLLGGLRTGDYSFIVRTAGIEQPEEPIKNDAENLVRTWGAILEKYKKVNGPGLLHNDHDLISRLVRDALPADFQEILCDDATDAEKVCHQLSETMPDKVDRVSVYTDPAPIFDANGVEKQIEESLAKKYLLPSGGSLIIDENEALTAIDVNTGRFIGKKDQEKTSLKTNMEACEVIARQIRVRDIGGIIAIDFIDMLTRSHQERVSEELKKHIQKDRAKTAVGRIGDFGLMVITRKRQRMSLQKQVFDKCGYCDGTGFVRKSDETFRALKGEIKKLMASDEKVTSLIVSGHPRFTDSLSVRYRVFFENLKRDHECEVMYRPDPNFHLEDFTVTPVLMPQNDAGRLPEERILPEFRQVALANYDDFEFDGVKGPITDDPMPEEVLESVEEEGDEEEAAPASPAAAPAASADQGGRRESSSQRRSRRRRKGGSKDGGNQQQPQDQNRPQEAPAAAKVPPPPQRQQPVIEVGGGETSLAEVAAAAAAASSSGEDEENENQQRRKRTRRGTRGGRSRRRRNGEEGSENESGANGEASADQSTEKVVPVSDPAPAVVASAASTPAPQARPAQPQPLVRNTQVHVIRTTPQQSPAAVAPVAKKPAVDFDSLLNLIEEEVKTIEPTPAAPTKAAAPKSAAAKTRASRPARKPAATKAKAPATKTAAAKPAAKAAAAKPAAATKAAAAKPAARKATATKAAAKPAATKKAAEPAKAKATKSASTSKAAPAKKKSPATAKAEPKKAATTAKKPAPRRKKSTAKGE